MDNENLSWKWELFRNKLALIENEFIEKNKDKYRSYFELHRALSRELKIKLGREKEDLLKLQLFFRVRKTLL